MPCRLTFGNNPTRSTFGRIVRRSVATAPMPNVPTAPAACWNVPDRRNPPARPRSPFTSLCTLSLVLGHVMCGIVAQVVRAGVDDWIFRFRVNYDEFMMNMHGGRTALALPARLWWQQRALAIHVDCAQL